MLTNHLISQYDYRYEILKQFVTTWIKTKTIQYDRLTEIVRRLKRRHNSMCILIPVLMIK